MKIYEARAEAKKRWGPLGIVRSRNGIKYVGKLEVMKNKAFKTFYGRGETWEQAFSDADAVELKIISPETELSAALEDARSLANFIDYHCVKDMPDALTREIVNKYTGTSDAALGK